MKTQWYKLGPNEKIPDGAREIVWRSIVGKYNHISYLDKPDIDFYNSQDFKDVGGLFVSCYSYGFIKDRLEGGALNIGG